MASALGLPWALAAALSACAGGGGASRAGASGVECVSYARAVSGIQLYGNAADWWDAAAGRYRRTSEPVPGAVLVFQRTARLPQGHVSVVARLRSAREILVAQANWVPGRVARSEPVIDVSPGNDWTAVRVWWAPSGVLGASTYPAFGFIEPRPAGGAAVVASR